MPTPNWPHWWTTSELRWRYRIGRRRRRRSAAPLAVRQRHPLVGESARAAAGVVRTERGRPEFQRRAGDGRRSLLRFEMKAGRAEAAVDHAVDVEDVARPGPAEPEHHRNR